MVVWGLVCQMKKETPRVVGVEVSRNDGEIVGRVLFDYSPSRHDSWPQKLAEIRRYVATELAPTVPVAVVVRTMEKWFPGRVPAQAPTRMRYQVEGVLLEVSRVHQVESVEDLSGQEIGARCGADKDAVLEHAKHLVDGSELLHEAAAAALAALATVEAA